jgi:hypothetical protein
LKMSSSEVSPAEQGAVHLDPAPGLAYAGGVLCLDCLSHRLGRPLRLNDFPMEVPLNRESWAAIWRAVTGSDSA